MPRLILFAPNVGVGGGLVLVRAILQAWAGRGRLTAILDERGRSAIGDLALAHDIHWVQSNLKGRWTAERLLARLALPDRIILCFHNLPPILAAPRRTMCFVHNAYLVGLAPSGSNRGWTRVRTVMEQGIARLFRGRISQYIVQTPSMADALRRWYGEGVPPVHVVPFLDMAAMTAQVAAASTGAQRRWDFLYVSDGPAHKNHRRLFAAWRLLAEQGDFPTLAVTLHPERDAALRAELAALVARHGLKIEDLGQVPHAQILAAYHQAGALLFPSYAESFGIPMVEAQLAGIPILASERDFVRDMCQPAETFDPFSERSIVRAVERFLYQRPSQVAMQSPAAFLETVFAAARDAES